MLSRLQIRMDIFSWVQSLHRNVYFSNLLIISHIYIFIKSRSTCGQMAFSFHQVSTVDQNVDLLRFHGFSPTSELVKDRHDIKWDVI